MKSDDVVILISGLLLIYSSNLAAGVCDVPLTQRAFNQGSNKDVASLVNQTKESLCSLEWSTQSEMKSAAKSAGLNIGYKAFNLTGSDSGSKVSSSKFEYRNEFCTLS